MHRSCDTLACRKKASINEWTQARQVSLVIGSSL